MQTTSLASAKGLAPFQASRAGRAGAGGRRRRALAVRAAAVVDDSTDLGALLRDALATPVRPAAPEVPAPAPEAPAAPAPAPDAPVPAPVVEAATPAVEAAAPAPAPPAPAPVVEAAAPATAAPVTVDPVPGTEILSGAAAPVPPPAAPPAPAPAAAPTQGMDFVLDQLEFKPPGFEDEVPAAAASAAAEAAQEPAKPLLESLGDAGKGLGEGLGDAGAAATQGLSSAADSVSSALGGAADSVGSALGGVSDSVGSALGGAADSVGSALGGVTDAAADAQAAAAAAAAQAAAAAAAAADSLTGALGGALGGASGAAAGAAGGAVSAAQDFVGKAAAEFDTEVSIIKANIDSLVGGVTAAVDGTTSAVSSQVGSQVAEVTEQLTALVPPEAREALVAAGAATASVVRQLSGLDPAVAAVLASVGLGVPALAAWNAAYGGYAGVVTPEEAMEALQSEDALLLDIRTEAEREAKGVAELKRGALGKGAAVPPVRLLPSISRRVRDPSGVALEIQALEAAALSKVNPTATKVIVMDVQGESAKTVARALQAVGVRRPYVLAGGFRAWSAAGLGVRQDLAEYDTSALDALSDTAESVVEAAATSLSPLKEPRTAVLAAAALGGLGFAAANFHTTLQFLGVLGLELTLVSRALQYDSLQDALDDLAALGRGVTGVATLPLKAAEALQGRGAGVRQQQRQQQQQQQAAGEGEA